MIRSLGGTLIFSFIRRIGPFWGFKRLEFQYFEGFRKNEYFFFGGGGGGWGYEDFEDIFGSS